jgi:diguanylate cyclase (GGDEF)-like protein/PAS domain S-box-containing protein
VIETEGGVGEAATGDAAQATVPLRALDVLRDVLLVTDAEGRIASVSRSVRDVLGHDAEALVGRSSLDLLPPDDREAAGRLLAQRFAGLAGRTIAHRALHADGGVRHLESVVEPLADGHEFRGVAIAARDVTARIEASRRLERSLAVPAGLVQLAQLLAVSASDAFWQAALELTVGLVQGAEGGSVLVRRDDGSFGFEAVKGFDAEALRSIVATPVESQRGGPPRSERWSARRPDERFTADVYARGPRPVAMGSALSLPLVVAGRVHGYLDLANFEREDAFDDDDVHVAEAVAAQLASALQRRMLERELHAERERFEAMASHDALTELPNRRLFQDRLQQALARARRRDRRVGVLFIDLDGFKGVNDRHGHGAGDGVLVAIGARLVAAVRGEDTVARIGGDEFGVLLADVNDAEDAAAVGGKLLVAMSTPMTVEGTAVRLGASVGVAVFPDHGIDPDAVMRAADDAMVRVKGDGKDGVRIADDDVGVDPRQGR